MSPRVRIGRTSRLLTVLTGLAAGSLGAQGTTGSASAPAAMLGHASADSAQALLNLIMTVNRDEIAAGKLALAKATRPEVRAYAQRVIDDYSTAMREWADKAPSVSLTVQDSASSATKSMASMRGSAAMANGVSEVRDTTTAKRGGFGGAAIHSANLATMTELRNATGGDFDTRYIKAQLEGHDSVLKELETHPTTYTQLQTMLTKFRTAIEDHRSAARKLLM